MESQNGVAKQGLVGAERLPSPQPGAETVVSPPVEGLGGFPGRGVCTLARPRRLHLCGVRRFGPLGSGVRRLAEKSHCGPYTHVLLPC